ncbi:hypothetical protein CDD81_6708 [Ophiocordyceps australis]|uniref:Dethiobiotin synthase n=1 Tax=Ophiocordyceps australis TaxID=1399860 RepID=A0A2C5Y564_9HYPO|nr:hypothetical protein CDD81_6708 [Ophiocordyceps australis]
MTTPLPSVLCRSLHIFQVFGANTAVGKTVCTTLLANTAKRLFRSQQVTFLKPVSTGSPHEADQGHIERFATQVLPKTLFQYDLAVSPHAAALASGKPVPSDHELLARCRDFITHRAGLGPGWLFVETAGGVHSPAPSGTTQANLYIPLRIPSILVGDSGLGGISQTIAAFESLHLRGYTVESIVLFQNPCHQNCEFLAQYFNKHHGIPVLGLPAPPVKMQDADCDALAMQKYYSHEQCQEVAGKALEQLHNSHEQRLFRLETMATKAHKQIWYPFTQQSLLAPKDIITIDSAHQDSFQTLLPQCCNQASHEPLLQSSFDGSASWWTQGLGHANPQLTLAAAHAAGRYGHVMFAGAVHEPAMALAETLLQGMASQRLTRVFFSDNGSTGNEVALKMALRAARLRYGWGAREPIGVLGLRGGYHGDTIGAMDSTEPGAFNQKVEWYEGKGFWLDYPTILCSNGKWTISTTAEDGSTDQLGTGSSFASLADVFDVESREECGEHKRYELYILGILEQLQREGRRLGALILEPVVLGAGGMRLVDPLFQRTLVKLVRRSAHLFGSCSHGAVEACDWSGLPIIFDEVFTGLYRLGRFSSASFLGVDADISVHAKLLTGGLVPLCVTLASEAIFGAFGSPDKTDALLHGHSYTAHPVGCQVAVESVRELQAMDRRGAWDWAQTDGWTRVWSVWPHSLVDRLSRKTSRVVGVWALGSVLAIHLSDGSGTGYGSNAALGLRKALAKQRDSFNIHSRVLGNVLYLMTGQTTSQSTVKLVADLVNKEF